MTVYERIYRVIRRIPAGSVATYGQVAKLAGGCSARQVGYALSALEAGTSVPWQRVINSQGKISLRSTGDSHGTQRRLLRKEGIVFRRNGSVDLAAFRWGAAPPGRMPDPAQDFSDITRKEKGK